MTQHSNRNTTGSLANDDCFLTIRAVSGQVLGKVEVIKTSGRITRFRAVVPQADGSYVEVTNDDRKSKALQAIRDYWDRQTEGAK